MALQQTLVLIKPDAMKRSLAGLVLMKLEEAKLLLVAASLKRVDMALAEEHYIQHKGKHFYSQLIEYITGRLHGNPPERVLALVLEGDNAIQKIRDLAGNTNPEKAEPNSIRGMFGRITTAGVFENVVHASANPLEAEREIKLWFTPDEMVHTIYPIKKKGATQGWERIPTLEELNAGA
jgi:nucleoside-diphosphate kinase